MEFYDSLKNIAVNMHRVKTWENDQDNIDERRKKLRKKYPASPEKLEKAQAMGRAVVNAVDISDDYSETSAQKMEMVTESIVGLAVLPFAPLIGLSSFMQLSHSGFADFLRSKISMPLAKKISMFSGAAPFIVSIPLILWGTHKQKEASRVARFKARETELADPKNFVEYTTKQLKQAEKIAKNLPDVNKKEKDEEAQSWKKFIPFYNLYKIYSNFSNDKKDYNNWLKSHPGLLEQELQAKKDNMSSETLEQAKIDRDIITRVIQKINLKSEEYAENTETAVMTASFLATLGGLASSIVATGISIILQKLKIVPKSNLINGAVGAVSFLVPTLLPIMTNKYIIESARIGRFKAKQELLNDPYNYIYYDAKQKESVKNIQVPQENNKGWIKTAKDNIKFFFQIWKDGKEYEDYKKNQEEKENKIKKALLKIDITDEQMTRAKNLQEKVFNVFEKTDEMWQRYSEDAESAINILNQAIPMIMTGIIAIPAGITAFLMKTQSGRKIVDSTKSFIQKPGIQNTLQKINNRAKKILNPVFKPMGKITGKGLKNIKNLPVIRKDPIFAAVIAGMVSGIGAMLIGMLSFSSKLTQFQKDAGKLGFMEAMKDLQDPVYFVDKYPSQNSFGSTDREKTNKFKESQNINPFVEKILQNRKKNSSISPNIKNDNDFMNNWFIKFRYNKTQQTG